jgi:ATP-dependent protease ClpP protease subunit
MLQRRRLTKWAAATRDRYKNMNKNLLPKSLLDKWNPSLKINAAANVIQILDVIGFDYYDGGITAKTISDALEEMNGQDVEVVMNSPGGDMFEGIAIHNVLKSYEGKVTIDIIGIAASAASVIALAGDKIRIAETAFFMIHNAWTHASGDKAYFREMAEYLEPFDKSMGELYAKKSGIAFEEIVALMDKETFFSGSETVEKGFADEILNEEIEESEEKTKALKATRELEAALRTYGKSRSETKAILKEFSGKRNATKQDEPQAVNLASLSEGFSDFMR